MIYWLLALLCVVCYFIGNVNFGKIISSAKHVDLSKKGSGNLGATNMYRNLGAKLGYLTLVLDAIKGFVSAGIGFFAFGGAWFGGLTVYPDAIIGLYACGLSAVVGHIFPVIYRFKGGKGISTSLGVFLFAQPIVTLVTFCLCFVLVWFVKYVSLASLLLITVSVVWQNIFLPKPNLVITLLTFGIFALTWYAHRPNIERLLSGTERETNIRVKLVRDQKRQDKITKRQDEKQEKFFEREEKREIKQEQKEIKQEQKQVEKEERQTRKAEHRTNRKIKSSKKSTRTTKKSTKKTKKLSQGIETDKNS